MSTKKERQGLDVIQEEVSGGKQASSGAEVISASAETATQAGRVIDQANGGDSKVEELKSKLTKASDQLRAVLIPMEKSPTGVGIRAKDGTLCAVDFEWHNEDVHCTYTVVVQGPSLDGAVTKTNSFYIPGAVTNPEGFIERQQRENHSLHCLQALAHNPSLVGRLRVKEFGLGIGVVYLWEGKELTIFLEGGSRRFFISGDELKDIAGSFDPESVTAKNIDAVIQALTVEAAPEAESTQETAQPVPVTRVVLPLEMVSGHVNEICANSLDAPKGVQGKNGPIAYGSDEGLNYKNWNEDRVVVNTEKRAFAVVDGMGGEGMEGSGEQAAKILAEELQEGFENGLSIEIVQSRAHERMVKNMRYGGGACYIAAKIEGSRLHVFQAGDVKLIVIDRQGDIKFKTQDEGFRGKVTNAVSARFRGATTYSSIDLAVGDRVVIASDGLWDNVAGEAIDLIAGKPIAEVIASLNRHAKEKMRNYRELREKGVDAKPDNISVFIHDIENLD